MMNLGSKSAVKATAAHVAVGSLRWNEATSEEMSAVIWQQGSSLLGRG